MMSRAFLAALSDFFAGLAAASVSGAAANVSPSVAALRRMVRTSSSTERPFLAARRRSRFFSASSSCRTVRLAIEKSNEFNGYISI